MPEEVSQGDLLERPPTVLVVEDEVLVRMLICDFLRDCGFRVIEAANADEATRVLSTGDPVDVVFTDIHMPGTLDGFGLAKWIRAERPGVKVILTSGLARTVEAAGDLCDHGPVMAKPYDLQEVERRIRQHLARE